MSRYRSSPPSRRRTRSRIEGRPGRENDEAAGADHGPGGDFLTLQQALSARIAVEQAERDPRALGEFARKS